MGDLIDKEVNKARDFIFGIGYFSEIIIALVVIYALNNNLLDISIFIFFFFLSGYSNTLFKSFIKQPRPDGSKKFLYSEHFSGVKKMYGMPSGHSQNVFYSITYLYLIAKDGMYWLQLGLVLATLMIYERWTFHNHTLLQLFAGAMMGILIGFIVFSIRNKIYSSLILGAK
jgi:membrane-associated phospholipid phosphatase